MIFNSKPLTKGERLGCASLRGKNHKQANVPNQDSAIAKKNKYGIFMAVADGVGSQIFSQYGSKAAVNAAYYAFLKFETGLIPVTAITKTIFELYKEKVSKGKAAHASTTCVFAYISKKHGLFIGQAGDGACYFSINDTFGVQNTQNHDFSNLVHPMNATKNNADWTTRHFNINQTDTINIMLATDGISEDIVPGKEKDCLQYFANDIKKRPGVFSSFLIEKQIRNWDVPGSNDDKTIIVYSKE